MNNDLDDLKAMMDTATPQPDAARRAENLALAQKNFDDFQGSRDGLRPTPVTEAKGLWTGVKTMLNTFTTKGGLTATTALVAVGFLYIAPEITNRGSENLTDDIGASLSDTPPPAPAPVQPIANEEPVQAEVAQLAAPQETVIAPPQPQRTEPVVETTRPQARSREADILAESVAPNAITNKTLAENEADDVMSALPPSLPSEEILLGITSSATFDGAGRVALSEVAPPAPPAADHRRGPCIHLLD